VGASAGAFDSLERGTVLRIIGHTSALTLVALARTCHHMRHLCRALVRARYCNQRGLSVKLRLPRADIWRLTVEADVVNESTLDDFEWLKTLGTGSFGRVRLVRHRRTGGYYAMKCLKKAMLLEHEQQDRLYWEKDIVSTLEHPFVVQFFRTFQDSVYVYLLFEFAAGGEIFHLICEHGRLQSRVAKFYAAETLLVLKYFATLNVVYRDIKPENLLLSAAGPHQVHRLWLRGRARRRRAVEGVSGVGRVHLARDDPRQGLRSQRRHVELWRAALRAARRPAAVCRRAHRHLVQHFQHRHRLSGAHRRRRERTSFSSCSCSIRRSG
jgi:serine/threonine protein kinase